MKRMMAAAIDLGICWVLACRGRILITVLGGWLLGDTGADIPWFTIPLGKVGESTGIGTFIVQYGFLSQYRLRFYLYVTVFFYLMVCEFCLGGSSPGKRLSGLSIRYSGRKGINLYRRHMERILLQILCLRLWCFTLVWYLQTKRMPYDHHLGIFVEERE